MARGSSWPAGRSSCSLFLALLPIGRRVVVFNVGYDWISAGSGALDVYLRSVVVGVGLRRLCVLPIIAKWTLIGRWKPQEIPIWSLRYFRFWLVRTLIRA